MSVLNFRIRPDRIDLLTDTMQYLKGEPVALCETKARVAASGNFAWSTRGLVRLGNVVDDLIANCPAADDAALVARVFVEKLADEVLGDSGVEVSIAGWSDQLAGLAVRIFKAQNGHPVTAMDFTSGVHLRPAPGNAPPLPEWVSQAQFRRLALAQWKMRDQFYGQLCIGGVMHQTTVTRDGASQQIVDLYPGYREDAARFGDPNAEAVTAFLAEQGAAAA